MCEIGVSHVIKSTISGSIREGSKDLGMSHEVVINQKMAREYIWQELHVNSSQFRKLLEEIGFEIS